MGFIVNTLPDYVERNRDRLVKAMVLGGKTIQRFSIQTGVKKNAAISILNVAPTAQSGSACGFNAAGNTTFTDRNIETAIIKYNLSWCKNDLLGKWTEYQVRIAARGDEQPMPFEEDITAELIKHANADTEKLIFQGDKSSADTLLKLNDGLCKIAANDAATIKTTIAAGTDAYSAIMAVYFAIPEKSVDGTEIYVSPDVYRKFMQSLVERNYYHFGVEPTDEIVIPGTDTKVVKAAGLAGASYILAANPQNIVYGCDLENDAEEYKLWYSNDADEFRVKMAWNPGANYAISDEVVIATLAGTIVAAPAVATAVAKLASTVNADDQINVKEN